MSSPYDGVPHPFLPALGTLCLDEATVGSRPPRYSRPALPMVLPPGLDRVRAQPDRLSPTFRGGVSPGDVAEATANAARFAARYRRESYSKLLPEHRRLGPGRIVEGIGGLDFMTYDLNTPPGDGPVEGANVGLKLEGTQGRGFACFRSHSTPRLHPRVCSHPAPARVPNPSFDTSATTRRPCHQAR